MSCHEEPETGRQTSSTLSRFLILITLLCLSPFCRSEARAETIKLRADLWCPYNCDPDSDKPGLIVEIARAIFIPAGHTVDYQVMPWSRTLNEVRKGHISGAIGALPSEAPDLIYGANPVAQDESGFAFKRDMAFTYHGTDSLAPYRIATIQDYNYDDGEIDAYLRKHAQNTTHIQVNTGGQAGVANLRKLLAGRVDLALDSRAVLAYLIHQEHLDQEIGTVGLGRLVGVHIGFSPALADSKNLADLLSSGVDRLRQQGELAAILARYGVKE
ncbi:MAG: transporter substrate-binding domain-containing protein [Magnetococcales bacterium]|nr:transporter substrate-binding domain-containing protein [Magnetococcales bacterium]MBF0322193.1 transporter substrate-binding domain-containing protein [Magnetococcales bacterium]